MHKEFEALGMQQELQHASDEEVLSIRMAQEHAREMADLREGYAVQVTGLKASYEDARWVGVFLREGDVGGGNVGDEHYKINVVSCTHPV